VLKLWRQIDRWIQWNILWLWANNKDGKIFNKMCYRV